MENLEDDDLLDMDLAGETGSGKPNTDEQEPVSSSSDPASLLADSSPSAGALARPDSSEKLEDVEAELLLLSSDPMTSDPVTSSTPRAPARLPPGKSKPSAVDVIDDDDLLIEDSDSSQVQIVGESREANKAHSENFSSAVEIIEDSSILNPDSVTEVLDDEDDDYGSEEGFIRQPSKSRKRKAGNGYDAVEIVDDEFDDVEIVGEEEEDSGGEMDLGEDDNSFIDGKVCIYYSNGALLVWNAQDAAMLREECRIVGAAIGCLPRTPRQNVMLGLPLRLMPEEAQLLVDIDAAVVVEEVEVGKSTLKQRQREFRAMRQNNEKQQLEMFRIQREEEVERKMPDIISGKKSKKMKLQEKKKQKKFSEEELVEDDVNQSTEIQTEAKDAAEEAERVEEFEAEVTVTEVMKDWTETNPKHTLVQLFTENPWRRPLQLADDFVFPTTERESLRYTVFKDLWKKGYYLTSGAKFGGDFLIYPGDPGRYHSHYICVCQAMEDATPAMSLVALGRMASNVRKTTLLASRSQRRRGSVVYTSLQWAGFS